MRNIVRPCDSVYGDSCLLNLIGHKDYLAYCYESARIQDYWRKPEFMAYPIHGTTGQSVPIVTSHINTGDFFNLGKSPQIAQIGMVTHKLSVIQAELPENWKPSPHKPGGNYLKYRIGGDIGGLFFEQSHAELICGFFFWLPLPCQLTAAGLADEAQELQSILSAMAMSRSEGSR